MPRIYRCLFVVLCFLVQTAVQAQNADINLLKSINNNESSFKNSFFKADAQSVTIINIAAPAALFIAGELKHNKQLKKMRCT